MAKTIGKNQNKPSHEEIARRAYTLFEQSGRIPGRDLENWLAAEAQLNGGGHKSNGNNEASQSPKPAHRPHPEPGQRRI
jgi:hypothetical protein